MTSLRRLEEAFSALQKEAPEQQQRPFLGRGVLRAALHSLPRFVSREANCFDLTDVAGLLASRASELSRLVDENHAALEERLFGSSSGKEPEEEDRRLPPPALPVSALWTLVILRVSRLSSKLSPAAVSGLLAASLKSAGDFNAEAERRRRAVCAKLLEATKQKDKAFPRGGDFLLTEGALRLTSRFESLEPKTERPPAEGASASTAHLVLRLQVLKAAPLVLGSAEPRQLASVAHVGGEVFFPESLLVSLWRKPARRRAQTPRQVFLSLPLQSASLLGAESLQEAENKRQRNGLCAEERRRVQLLDSLVRSAYALHLVVLQNAGSNGTRLSPRDSAQLLSATARLFARRPSPVLPSAVFLSSQQSQTSLSAALVPLLAETPSLLQKSSAIDVVATLSALARLSASGLCLRVAPTEKAGVLNALFKAASHFCPSFSLSQVLDSAVQDARRLWLGFLDAAGREEVRPSLLHFHDKVLERLVLSLTPTLFPKGHKRVSSLEDGRKLLAKAATELDWRAALSGVRTALSLEVTILASLSGLAL